MNDEAENRYPADLHLLGDGVSFFDMNEAEREAFAQGAVWARLSTLEEIDRLLVAKGDERTQKALDEQARGRSLAKDGERDKAQMAHDHAWAIRNQADGLWEAAAVVRDLVRGENK